MIVRTRLAPSPTGAPHIGSAYMALFNYAFARKHNGKFILRIEDTDRTRSTLQSEQAILDALSWLGFRWDEGPDVGGPHAPYRQSERSAIYRNYANILLENGKAYRCFCTPERLEVLRKEQAAKGEENFGYDGYCLKLTDEEIDLKLKEGVPYVIRLKVPEEGECVAYDRLRGEIRIPWKKVDHQILIKADGFPTYHLANVVDDHLMEITHVIRGEEWISSLPKHILLYEAFGWQKPEFIHLPLLRNPDKTKLSKRKNPTSILYYRKAGFLPEAMLNYLGLMGYSLPDGREVFSLNEMIETFDIDRISLGGPIFDIQKLQALNAKYIRTLSSDELYSRLKSWQLNDSHFKKIVPLAQPRLQQLSDFIPISAFLFEDKVKLDCDKMVSNELSAERVVQLFKIAQWQIESKADFNLQVIKEIFANMSEKEGLKLNKMLIPFFVAISGEQSSLPLFDSMEILGKDMTLRRLAYAIEAFEKKNVCLKGKALKALMEDYERRYGHKIE